ncbi:cupin domain-containing protein [Agaribacterium haliotis]|uniref:cupin domain-containing protein n=1 Tax=Agaribacterium haliotis TaxID=2013869 RepID=UPI000BB576A2|nr:cupin domain-containing protein [Agaribacterium haliotis]
MTDLETSLFGDISTEEFLRDYWQKKPLLIKQALPNFASPLSPDELGGLSLDAESQSRLMIDRDGQWELRHGPMQEDSFNDLPETNWTLLVQHADSLDPQVNALLQRFRFLPNWRLDDIMISYATDGGGVGPHFDYYDVFLLQAEGKRRWRTGQHCDGKSKLIEGQSSQILQEFDTVNDWVVEAGDLLYIPAQIAHWGEAVGESITYSIGFRSPSDSELLLDLSQQLSADLNEEQRYRDGDEIKQGHHSGLIPQAAIDNMQKRLAELVNQPEKIAQWLGAYATFPKPALEELMLPLDCLYSSDLGDNEFQLSPFSRACYIKHSEHCDCYIDGHCFELSEKLAQLICAYERIDGRSLNQDELKQLAVLASLNKLIFADSL